MSRACKSVAGLACLALVAGVTAVASGLPSAHQTSAASDVNVQFTVSDEKYLVEVSGITDDSVIYAGATAKVRIHYLMAKTVTVRLAKPNGSEVLVDTVTPNESDGSFEVTLPVSEFGEYILKISGTDTAGNQMPSNAISFRYKGASVTPPANPSGGGNQGSGEEEYTGNIKIGYGEGVCKVGIQAYGPSDIAKAHPLLNPEYVTDVEPVTNGLGEVEISRAELGLNSGEYTIVVTVYDCLNDNVIDSDEIVIPGVIEPPKTGAISILGVTVSQADYLVTGLAVFVLTAIFAIYLLNRRKKANRR